MSYKNEFETDSREYEILENAVKEIKSVDGLILEIGTRKGGSAKLIIDTLFNNSDTNRTMICVDPYGNIEYDVSETKFRYDYTNIMRNETIPSLYNYAFSKNLNFQFLCLEDTEFFSRYNDGLPVYDHNKCLMTKYALVFIDGPHSVEPVLTETKFFNDKMSQGGIIVYDDIQLYKHNTIEEFLLQNNFEIVDKKDCKASYKKR